METKRLINQLKKYPEDAILKLHSLHSTGGEVIDVTRVYDGTRYVAVLETTQDLTYPVEFNKRDPVSNSRTIGGLFGEKYGVG